MSADQNRIDDGLDYKNRIMLPNGPLGLKRDRFQVLRLRYPSTRFHRILIVPILVGMPHLTQEGRLCGGWMHEGSTHWTNFANRVSRL